MKLYLCGFEIQHHVWTFSQIYIDISAICQNEEVKCLENYNRSIDIAFTITQDGMVEFSKTRNIKTNVNLIIASYSRNIMSEIELWIMIQIV